MGGRSVEFSLSGMSAELERDGFSLSFAQKVLLTTDGTVTHILEAYAGEPITVVKLSEFSEWWDGADGELALEPGDRVLRRTVLLTGKRTSRAFIYAESVITDRVGSDLLYDLVTGDTPIGKILARSRLETFRELLDYGREPAGAAGAHLGVEATDMLIWRRYRVLARQKPIMMITEKFPVSAFRLPSEAADDPLLTVPARSV